MSKSSWAVLALTLHIELFTQVHYLGSIDKDAKVSPLFRDVFFYHWKEESQHAILDELEWKRVDAGMTPEGREKAVDEFIELVVAVDGIIRAQAAADASYFAATSGRPLTESECAALRSGVLSAYRWQYIVSGAHHPRFLKVLSSHVTAAQAARIQATLAALT